MNKTTLQQTFYNSNNRNERFKLICQNSTRNRKIRSNRKVYTINNIYDIVDLLNKPHDYDYFELKNDYLKKIDDNYFQYIPHQLVKNNFKNLIDLEHEMLRTYTIQVSGLLNECYDYITDNIVLTTLILDSKKITNIIIAEGVEIIPAGYFKNCIALEEVTLPSTLKIIGSEAFEGTNLKQIVIPHDVEALELNTFRYCNQLKKVIIHGDTLIENQNNSSLSFEFTKV